MVHKCGPQCQIQTAGAVEKALTVKVLGEVLLLAGELGPP